VREVAEALSGSPVAEEQSSARDRRLALERALDAAIAGFGYRERAVVVPVEGAHIDLAGLRTLGDAVRERPALLLLSYSEIGQPRSNPCRGPRSRPQR
jgi:hypothetical protein